MREIRTAGVTGDRCRYSNFLQLWNRSATVAGACDDEHEDDDEDDDDEEKQDGRKEVDDDNENNSGITMKLPASTCQAGPSRDMAATWLSVMISVRAATIPLTWLLLGCHRTRHRLKSAGTELRCAWDKDLCPLVKFPLWTLQSQTSWVSSN